MDGQLFENMSKKCHNVTICQCWTSLPPKWSKNEMVTALIYAAYPVIGYYKSRLEWHSFQPMSEFSYLNNIHVIEEGASSFFWGERLLVLSWITPFCITLSSTDVQMIKKYVWFATLNKLNIRTLIWIYSHFSIITLYIIISHRPTSTCCVKSTLN